ncbi:type II toxin-antitoxin system HipA family toxin [Mariniblastus sp.]|nr:type II toxin-antitoxin system HipA family toxin [Mariniblastus sp.]
MTTARVILWGRDIAAVTWDESREIGVFQYHPDFISSEIQVAPLTMPLSEGVFEFPSLSAETFKGLPGLLSDSLPDKFGNALIDAWLATQNRTPDSLNPVERLCYIGARGMGALEFQPTPGFTTAPRQNIQVEQLVRLANKVLNTRKSLAGEFTGHDDTAAIQDILRVGTSAGGARAKAILAWNEETGEFRSGQVAQQEGFTQWIMKFDGIANNRDKELADPQGYGLIEYAYHLMALESGINMTRCRIHHEGGRAHFMTQRFDRQHDLESGNGKLHMQSLGAMMHFDFNQPGAYSYEQAVQAMLILGLPMQQIEQQYRRAALNVIARNQDDHVKNIAFLMDRLGEWSLSPAFDVAYSYNPSGAWTSRHQMSINGKRDAIELSDLLQLASVGGIKKKKATSIVKEVANAVSSWPAHARSAGVSNQVAAKISKTFRLPLR